MTSPATTPAVEAAPESSLERKRFIRVMAVLGVSLLLVIALFVGSLVVRARRDDALPPYFRTPSFALTDQEGRAFSSDALRGKVWVASFVFTRCREICPMLTSRLVQAQQRLAHHGDRVQIVSFSVDPLNDTPPALKAFASRHGASLGNWHFLTGEAAPMQEMIEKGFKTPVEETIADGEVVDVLHGTRFLLVDATGMVRGVFESDAEGITSLVDATGVLLEESR